MLTDIRIILLTETFLVCVFAYLILTAKRQLVRILMLDESADFKHIIMTVSQNMPHILGAVWHTNTYSWKELSFEFVLADPNPHVQARNKILMTILSSNYAKSDKSIAKAFTCILYNTHLDEESFSVLASTLNR